MLHRCSHAILPLFQNLHVTCKMSWMGFLVPSVESICSKTSHHVHMPSFSIYTMLFFIRTLYYSSSRNSSTGIIFLSYGGKSCKFPSISEISNRRENGCYRKNVPSNLQSPSATRGNHSKTLDILNVSLTTCNVHESLYNLKHSVYFLQNKEQT